MKGGGCTSLVRTTRARDSNAPDRARNPSRPEYPRPSGRVKGFVSCSQIYRWRGPGEGKPTRSVGGRDADWLAVGGSLVRTRLSLLSREHTGNSAGFGVAARSRIGEKGQFPATLGGFPGPWNRERSPVEQGISRPG